MSAARREPCERDGARLAGKDARAPRQTHSQTALEQRKSEAACHAASLISSVMAGLIHFLTVIVTVAVAVPPLPSLTL